MDSDTDATLANWWMDVINFSNNDGFPNFSYVFLGCNKDVTCQYLGTVSVNNVYEPGYN